MFVIGEVVVVIRSCRLVAVLHFISKRFMLENHCEAARIKVKLPVII